MGELLEGPAQSPVRSIKDTLISNDYGSGPNFTSYTLPTIFNPASYTRSKSLQKIFFSADWYTLDRSAESFPKAITSDWLLPDGLSASTSTHSYLPFSKILTRTCRLWRKIIWTPRPIFCHNPTHSLIIKYSVSKNLNILYSCWHL